MYPCHLCGEGHVGLWRCGVCRRVVAWCDECDATWPNAAAIGPPTYSTEGDHPCPACRASLAGNGARRATEARHNQNRAPTVRAPTLGAEGP